MLRPFDHFGISKPLRSPGRKWVNIPDQHDDRTDGGNSCKERRHHTSKTAEPEMTRTDRHSADEAYSTGRAVRERVLPLHVSTRASVPHVHLDDGRPA